ncbi:MULTISPECIES: trypsin-like peptidase domain-containing protein [Candidatus Ichthyocystis]|uniref:Putative signalling peptidase n=1 Tax=Candidatus Ichthyocystis hellenicum TaxID=1561003 RepID=A0A0S4M973_9BURK|nr:MULTISPECIES: trypsin-like peptidase domain-containing protein [Ichthyocystis]CUT18004.1 putative signalling peptidase [Candidatus Ichthyocystis hellenicum]
MSMAKIVKRFFSYLLVGVLGAVVGSGAYQMYLTKKALIFNANEVLPIKSASVVPSNHAADTLHSFSSILSVARPSVVHVRVTHRPDFFEWGIDNILRDLDSWFGQLDESLRVHKRQTQGIHSFYDVSGVVISSDGYILTSAYLLYGAERVQVVASTNKLFDAQVIGLDRNSGLALIKIANDKPLTPVKLANMKNISVNQWVISIGYDDTVSHGVIRSYMPHHFILTDALLTAKGVGGVLVNMDGDLVGINTPHVDFSNNFSFVIPSDYALRVSTELKRNGFVRPTYLGVVAQNLTPDLANSFKLKLNSCVLVSQVMAGSPALLAGIKSGDCISQFENHAVTNVDEFYSLVASHDALNPASVSLWRGSDLQKFTVKWSNSASNSIANDDKSFRFYAPMGISLREMSPDELKLARTKNGLFVGHILQTGTAYQVGIRSGDVLIAMNGKPLTQLKQFDDMINSPSKSASFLIQRAYDRAFVAVEKK